jgi:hypothetical protein
VLIQALGKCDVLLDYFATRLRTAEEPFARVAIVTAVCNRSAKSPVTNRSSHRCSSGNALQALPTSPTNTIYEVTFPFSPF